MILGSRSHLSFARLAHFPVLCDNYPMTVIVLLFNFLQGHPGDRALPGIAWRPSEKSAPPSSP
jgi:hypothetical protein